jgi:uncharacterized protein involved in exopolysaccharide biosynthesis
MDTATRKVVDEPELRLAELLQVLKRWRRGILVFALASTVGGVLYAWLVPPTYKALIVISPVGLSRSGAGQMGALGSMLSQFGGDLASLGGFASPEDTRKAESIAVLQSEALTEAYIKQNDLLPVLYARLWNARDKRWNVTDPREIPTLWKANRYFKSKVRTFETDPKTKLLTMTIAWRDPHLAAKWANDLVNLANDWLRNKALDESERNIAYLTAQAAKTDEVEVKQAIYYLMETEIDSEMVARGSNEYAFKILDPAVAPERPSSLPRWAVVLLAFVGSLVLSTSAAFVRVAWLRG